MARGASGGDLRKRMKPQKSQFVGLVLAITRGIVRDQRMRRTVLFYVVLTAMFMAFAGGFLFPNWLIARPWLFIFYWLGCAWLTLLSFMMALFDMLAVGRAAREERKRLRREIFEKEP